MASYCDFSLTYKKQLWGPKHCLCIIRRDLLGSILSTLDEHLHTYRDIPTPKTIQHLGYPLPGPSQPLKLSSIWVKVLNLGMDNEEETKFMKLFITSARKITHFLIDSIPNLYGLHNLLFYLLNSNTCCGHLHEIIFHFLANIKSQNSLGLWHGSYFVHSLRSKPTLWPENCKGRFGCKVAFLSEATSEKIEG